MACRQEKRSESSHLLYLQQDLGREKKDTILAMQALAYEQRH